MDFLYIIIIWLSSLALGRTFLKLFKIDIDDNLKNLISISIGWAILSFYILFLVGFHILYKDIVLYSLLLLSLIGIYQLKSSFRIPKLNIDVKNNKFNILLVILIIYLSLFNLLDVFSPPSVADSLVYHFKIPMTYIKENGFFYNPFFHYNAPHLLEIFSIVGFVLNGENLVHLQYYSFSFLILWTLLVISKKCSSNYSIGLFAFAIYFVTPMSTDLKSAGYVEIGLSLMTILSIWTLFESLKEKVLNKKYFILSAIFLGIALSIKYYALFTVVITFFIVIAYFLKRKINIKDSIKYLLLYSFFVLLFGLFFYVMNYINTGNPLYPALFNIFGGLNYSTELHAIMKEMIVLNKRPAGEDLWGFITSLWNITMDGDKFLAGRNGLGAILLLLPLFLIPFSKLITKDNKRLAYFFIIFIVGFWILWYVLAIQRTRHLLPFAILLIFIVSIKMYDLKNHNFYNSKLLKFTINSFWLIFFGFALAVNLIFTKQFIPVALNKIDKEVYLEKKLPHYKGIKWVNDNLPKDAYIYNLISYREYYLKRKSYYPSPYFQGWYDFTKIKDVDTFYKKLKKDGFTHIVLKSGFIDTTNIDDKFKKHYFEMLNQITAKYCTKIKVIKDKSQVSRTSGKIQEHEVHVYVID